MLRTILATLLCLLSLSIGAKSQQPTDSIALTADGPYIVYDSLGTGATIISVDTKGRIINKHYKSIASNQAFNVTTSDGKYSFKVQLHNIQQPQWHYDEPKRLFITSDPHANFGCLYNLLLENGIIDSNCNWTYGKGHFALIGDVMDRGTDVLPIYWLLYKLEAEAAQAGGAVHFMLGNHEPLVLMNDNRYTTPNYLAMASRLGVPYNYFFSPRTELGRWIISRNTIERIGRNILVHAGLSREFYDSGLSIPEVNALVPAGLYKHKAERKAAGKSVAFLHATYGPIWYRGLVRSDEKNHPLSSDSLNLMLTRFQADRIIVGHTIHEEVTSFYEGRVIGVNVDNVDNRESNRSRALLIEDGKLYLIGNKARRMPLDPR